MAEQGAFSQSADRPEVVIPQKTAVPAVAIEQAVQNDKVICLCCGQSFTMLKRHLKAEHGLTEEQYREKFSLPSSFPLVAPAYSARKAEYAKQAGLGKHDRRS
jgi:predicted transcriptional regulator